MTAAKIANAADLKDAIAAGGSDLMLTSDIVFPSGGSGNIVQVENVSTPLNLNLDGNTIEMDQETHDLFLFNHVTNATIVDGKLTHTTVPASSWGYNWAIVELRYSDLTMDNVTVEQTDGLATAIRVGYQSSLTISNSKIIGPDKICEKNSGGTATRRGLALWLDNQRNTVITNNTVIQGGVFIDSPASPAAASKVTINSGDYTEAVFYYDDHNTEPLVLYGGTFGSDPSKDDFLKEVDDSGLTGKTCAATIPDGYKAVQNSNGTWTVQAQTTSD
jgi:hypothetical protein